MKSRFLLLLPLIAACGTEDDVEVDAILSEDQLELRTNSDANRVVVYSNNIENMIFDWKDLVHEMEEHALRPDVFLVQQISSKEELDRLIAFMNRRLGVDYDGVVAQNVPDDQRFQNQVTPRPTVTTGIIWRSRRFELATKDSWMPWGSGFKNQAKTCDERSNHSGYETLRVKLFDKRAEKHVVVASLRNWTWHPCSTKNMRSIVNGEEGGRNDHAGMGSQSALHIIGGDFNDGLFTEGRYKCWYRYMNRALDNGSCPNNDDFGFTDPLYQHCGGDRDCVRNKGGIDSIFVRRSDGRPARTSDFDVISFDQAHNASVRATGGDARSNTNADQGYNDAGNSYSQHKARRAYFYYN